MIKRSVCK
jgi:hypothetical protein